LSKAEIINKLKEKNSNLNKSELSEILNIFSQGIKKALIEGKNIELRGFGTFFTKKINEKFSARNPKTGEIIYVPKKTKVRFKMSKKMKQLINK
tara:strand:- start:360 stop:641 length:282 start_codon:yes stop_codon:yes gene_type:complete